MGGGFNLPKDNVAYCPFKDSESKRAIADAIAGFKDFDQQVRWHGQGTAPLFDVLWCQPLCVFTCGHESYVYVQASDGSRLTLKDLAQQLFEDGLSVGHEVIRVFNCKTKRVVSLEIGLDFEMRLSGNFTSVGKQYDSTGSADPNKPKYVTVLMMENFSFDHLLRF
jgi:hypothetical protein